MEILDKIIAVCCFPGVITVAVCFLLVFAKLIIYSVIGYFKGVESSKRAFVPLLVSSGSAAIIAHTLRNGSEPIEPLFMAIMVPLYIILQHIENISSEKEKKMKERKEDEKGIDKN